VDAESQELSQLGGMGSMMNRQVERDYGEIDAGDNDIFEQDNCK